MNDNKNWREEKESWIENGATCEVMKGTHQGKTGAIADINWSKTGHITVTVIQSTGIKFKTLARNLRSDNS